MGKCRNLIIYATSVLISICVSTDICASIMPSILKSNCSQVDLCLDNWLASYGTISIFFNYIRLADLISIISAYGGDVHISLSHFVCRIGFDIILILFHLTEAIIGIIIFQTQILPDANKHVFYDYNIMCAFVITAIISNFCWAMFAAIFIYLKTFLLQRIPIEDQS